MKAVSLRGTTVGRALFSAILVVIACSACTGGPAEEQDTRATEQPSREGFASLQDYYQHAASFMDEENLRLRAIEFKGPSVNDHRSYRPETLSLFVDKEESDTTDELFYDWRDDSSDEFLLRASQNTYDSPVISFDTLPTFSSVMREIFSTQCCEYLSPCGNGTFTIQATLSDPQGRELNDENKMALLKWENTQWEKDEYFWETFWIDGWACSENVDRFVKQQA